MKKRPSNPTTGTHTTVRAPKYDVLAIGASAGGFTALMEVLAGFDSNLRASVLVVQHLDPKRKSIIAELLSKRTAIPVKLAEHGERMLSGVVYIAPPDEHLLAGPGKLQLAHSQLVHFVRPSVDLLFESVAGTYGSHSIGVVLSGTGRDGAAGIRAIKQAGGVTVAQDPANSEFNAMPQAAVATGCVDLILPLSELGLRLKELCNGTSRNKHGVA
jgi:two-component system, chemotaxis family, protein-glutamate methylesterase/glutaminase